MRPHRLPGWLLLLAVVLFGGVSASGAPEDDLVFLEDGSPVEVTMAAGTDVWTARLDLPAEADALAVVVSGERNVDLHLRHGRPMGSDPASADVSATGEAAHEVIVLGPSTTPHVRRGAWFVTVRNPYPVEESTSFEIAAFVDLKGWRRTLLPGAQVTVSVPPPGSAFAMRTWVPRRAVGASVYLTPAVVEGLRYTLEGPGGFRRRATTQERIDLVDKDAPRGVYTLKLAAPTPSVRPPRLKARATWSFAGGLVLPRPSSPLLVPGRPTPVLMGGPANGSVQPFRVRVRKGSRGFILSATSTASVNVDLFVRRGAPPLRRDEDAQWMGLRVGPSERVVVGGAVEMPPGEFHVEVLLVEDEKPVEVLVTQQPLDGPSGPNAWGASEPPSLTPDEWDDGVVKVFDSAMSWHLVTAPAGATSIHAQLLDATGPLELVLVRRGDGSIAARSFTPLVDEHLEATFPAPLPSERDFLLGVLNRATWDSEVAYRVAVAFDRRPSLPDSLRWPPAMQPEALTAPERTAAATVEITIGDCSGGSGVCVTPDGLVLSCRHCLELQRKEQGVQHEGILVAFPRSLERPPVQAYYARILDENADRDLVLLAPLRDVFNRPLPSDLRLPYLPLGDSRKARLGEATYVAGYPQMGSDCTRTAVVVSKGIVAGLERRPDGHAWLKTDAWVAPGHSGGPLADGEGRLIGIAAATLGSTESLGLAIPVSRIPEAWRTIIRQHLEAAGEE